MIASSKAARLLWAAVGAALALAACALPARWPPELDVQRLVIEPLAAVGPVRLEEDGWSSEAALKGAVAGTSVGVAVGGLACAATGPMAPLCLVTVLPLTTVLGTVSGTSVGKTVARNSPDAAQKAALLQPAWSALNQRAPLADLVAQRLPPGPDAGTAPPWRAQVGYAVLGTAGSGAGRPFALQATARVAVWYASETQPRAERAYVAQSESLTLEQWRVDDAQALRRALDDLAAALATQIAGDAMNPPGTPSPR